MTKIWLAELLEQKQAKKRKRAGFTPPFGLILNELLTGDQVPRRDFPWLNRFLPEKRHEFGDVPPKIGLLILFPALFAALASPLDSPSRKVLPVFVDDSH
jgi:hypothetical protein